MSSDPFAKRPRRPKRLGKYEVVRHIATGGMGAVYRAIDTVLNREVALKVLPPGTAAQGNALERFRREARNGAKLRHENIVTIYEFDQAGSTFYLAMELIDGIDLQEHIDRKGRLDPEEARQITIQAARALDHAHSLGVVHRDVKPSNFLITLKGDQLLVKMSDFGLARETTDAETRVTRDGTTVGTIDYMAPEQARDCGSADCRSDIYSLGCTLFHMLTGRAPFEGSIPERVYKHSHEEPPDLQQLNPRVSEALCAVVRRMLAKDPAERYPTPAALLKDLVRLESATAVPTGKDVLAGLAFAAGEPVRPARRRPSSAERAAHLPRTEPVSRPAPPAPPLPPSGRRRAQSAPAEKPEPRPAAAPTRLAPWVWLLAAGAVVVVLVVVALLVALRQTRAG
jgi:serine/threonine-protein kinase